MSTFFRTNKESRKLVDFDVLVALFPLALQHLRPVQARQRRAIARIEDPPVDVLLALLEPRAGGVPAYEELLHAGLGRAQLAGGLLAPPGQEADGLFVHVLDPLLVGAAVLAQPGDLERGAEEAQQEQEGHEGAVVDDGPLLRRAVVAGVVVPLPVLPRRVRVDRVVPRPGGPRRSVSSGEATAATATAAIIRMTLPSNPPLVVCFTLDRVGEDLVGGHDQPVALEPHLAGEALAQRVPVAGHVRVVDLDQGVEAGLAVRSVALLLEDVVGSERRSGRP